MNKRITEATKQEIAETMKREAIRLISQKRKQNVICEGASEYTGEITYANKYQQKQANSEGLGLEYRLYKANDKRRERIKAKITKMCETKRAVFLTLTFSDRMFARGCSSETRKRYITRFLKSECVEYLANIDFGSTNQREHYHAVVIPKTTIDFEKYRKIFDSNINAKRIISNEASIKLLGRYINKLTNHALKENGFYQRLIFSRNTK